MLEEVAEGLDAAEGVEVEVACAPSLCALAQFDLLVQIVGNLAANAAKHADGGRIRISARPSGANAVVVEVTDSGAGISSADRGRVFDRFYSGSGGRREGFGLGLAIVREAVRALGGVVELESEAGRGTTARVILAASQEAAMIRSFVARRS